MDKAKKYKITGYALLTLGICIGIGVCISSSGSVTERVFSYVSGLLIGFGVGAANVPI